jgi:hypothetical protein
VNNCDNSAKRLVALVEAGYHCAIESFNFGALVAGDELIQQPTRLGSPN